MGNYSQQNTVDIAKRREWMGGIPCFAHFTSLECDELAALMQEVSFSPYDNIVIENEIVDSVYIMVTGEAEVTHRIMKRKKSIQVPVAILRAGEAIGLNDTGFYSTTGNRTATVTAVTNVLALRLDLKDLHAFLGNHHLESAMYAATTNMLRMRLIKQSLPFAKLSAERLLWLANHVEEENFSAGAVVFNQGDKGEKCYLIHSGQVEIVTKDDGTEKRIALLKAPTMFGEATLITNESRNAAARATEETTLLTLRHEYLTELIETENNVAQVFMNLMVDRSRPAQNPHVSLHQRTTADGEEVTILKNPVNRSYFKLSKEGGFIWNKLDGKQTLQEITLDLAEQFNVFAPDVVAGLISKLARNGFISNLEIHDDLSKRSFWARWMSNIRHVAEMRFALGDVDAWVSRMYQKYIFYLFTKPGQLVLAFTAMLGFFTFVFYTPDVLLIFSFQHASLLLLLCLIPLSLAEVVLHELGHAFAVKACGREVHYIGVGWFWVAPIAFTDTSDMWIAARKPRILVNLAGVYVDILVAGLSSFGLFLTENPYAQCIFWLFALYTYIGAFRRLSPLQELDGYYLLMDWVEKTRLRQSAIVWLSKGFPLFREHKAEAIYWLACLLFIILISILTLIVQAFIFNIFGIAPSNRYFTLVLPVIVAAFSSLSIISDIRKVE